MVPIKDIVERVSEAFGPAADPAQVEALVSSLLETSGPTAPVFTGGCLYISLSDCSSLLTKTVRARAYDKIRRIASHFEAAQRESGLGGVRLITTSPLTEIAGKATASDLIVLARMLEDAAGDCSAPEIAGLAACSDFRIGPVASALLSVIPEVLQATRRVVIDVRAASPDAGVNVDAVAKAVSAVRRFQGAPEDLLRLRLTGAAATAEPADTSLFIRADAAAMIDGALRAATEAPLHDIASILKATAFGLGRTAAHQGESAAALLTGRSGLDVRFGGIELDLGTGSADDRTVPAAFAAAVSEGFRAAVADARLLPHRIVAAFSQATSDVAAGARLVEELGRSVCSPIVLHPLFSERSAGEFIRVGPFRDVRVEEPAERDWYRRGGRIPSPRNTG